MTGRLDVTPKTAEQNLIVRIGKSEAEVNNKGRYFSPETVLRDRRQSRSWNSKRLPSRYCTVEANYWQPRNIARPVCNSRSSCK